MPGSASQFIGETYKRPSRRNTLKGTANDERTLADSYNAFIWELAKKFTNSREEAEAAVREMLLDIQRCGENSAEPPPIEARLTARIALRRLMTFLQ